MTLPAVAHKSTIDFSTFDAMSANIEDIMLELPPLPVLQQQPPPPPQQQQQLLQQQQAAVEQPRLRLQEERARPALFVEAENELGAAAAIVPESRRAPPQVNNNNNNNNAVATAAATVFSAHELSVENVMPGIYLTTNFIPWNEENLRAHGFTHIIIIDKHIQELYYPSPLFKLVKTNTDPYESGAPFEYYCASDTTDGTAQRSLSFGKEFEAIDLNFGEKSYLTRVLPNCYRAVKFINKALQSDGTILVIDCNGGEQKCLTIVVAYLMYKYNLSFSNAFARLRNHYSKADLDRFYASQLYEYEPILQVQRLQSRGSSCSRVMHAAILKRKKHDDEFSSQNFEEALNNSSSSTTTPRDYSTSGFLHTINPLREFNVNISEQARSNTEQQKPLTQDYTKVQQELSIPPLIDLNSNLWSNNERQTYSNNTWDDYNME